MSQANAREDDPARHPIRVVSERTGLTPDLLRAWESRYHVVTPGRSEGGHRLYSDADVERLRLLHKVTLAGRSIGQVADHSTEALARLSREDDEARSEIPTEASGRMSATAADGYVARAVEAVHDLDAASLDRTLRRGALALGTSAYLQDVAAPLLRQIGELWHRGELRPSHEHLASVGIRRVVEWLMESGGRAQDRPRIVVATPAGEHHEMGALLAAAAAESVGWEAVYLGPDLPADDIATAAIQTGARAVALGAVYAPEPEALAAEVRDLRARLSPRLTLIVGGTAFDGLEQELRRDRVVPVSDMPELMRLLEGLEPTVRR
jgi:MerR family transcriptional regulator, light-induced transcriptional regulator